MKFLEDHWGTVAVYGCIFVAALLAVLLGVVHPPEVAAQDPSMLSIPSGGGGWDTVVAVVLMALAQGLAVLQAYLKTRGGERAKRIEELEEEIHGLEGEAKSARSVLEVQREARLRAELRLEGCEARCELCRHRPD